MRYEVKQPRTVFFPLHERLKALTRPDFGKLTQRFENALLLQNQTFKNPKLITCYLSPRKFHCSFFYQKWKLFTICIADANA